MSNILMTSGFNFEGYTITDYIGVYSGECALGTGFLSSLGAGFADFFGSNSGMYSDKLKKAKDYAINQLLEQVRRVGGNAVIGLDIDYTSFSSDIMGVVANGTAVRITKSDSSSQTKDTKYTIYNTNRGLPFRASALSIAPANNRYSLTLDLYHQDPCNITGIIADVIITNIFNDTTALTNTMFINFSEANNHHLICEPTFVKIEENIALAIKSVDVIIKKYICDNTITIISEENIELFSDMITEENEESVTFSAEDLINALDALDSSREILTFLQEYNETHNNILDPTLLSDIEKSVHIERMYGNTKKTSMSKVRKYFESRL